MKLGGCKLALIKFATLLFFEKFNWVKRLEGSEDRWLVSWKAMKKKGWDTDFHRFKQIMKI